MPRGRKIGNYNGKVSFNVDPFTRAAMIVLARSMGTDMQQAYRQIVRDRVEADGLQDAVAELALTMVQKPAE